MKTLVIVTVSVASYGKKVNLVKGTIAFVFTAAKSAMHAHCINILGTDLCSALL